MVTLIPATDILAEMQLAADVFISHGLVRVPTL
jgi:hypothetical protein